MSRADPYPSRVGGRAEILPRKDPVLHGAPPGDTSGPLAATALDAFDRAGYLALEGFLDETETRALRAEASRLRQALADSGAPEVIREPGSGEVRSVFAVHHASPVVARLAGTPRLLHAVMQILGSPAYVHQARINYKPGFRGREFYWHSDFETWHVEDGLPGMRTLSMSISLTENGPHNGPLLLIPGSQNLYVSCAGETPEAHHEASLKRQEYGVPDDRSLAQMVESQGIVAATGPAGGVTIFDCNTMHGSNGNITPWPRSNVFVVFNSLNNRPVDPFSGLEPRPGFLAEREDFTPLG